MDDLLCKEPFTELGRAVDDELKKYLAQQPAKKDVPKQGAPSVHVLEAPLLPTNLSDTGLNSKFLNALILKAFYILGLETNLEVAQHLKLSQIVVDQLLSSLKQQGFVDVRGAAARNPAIMRYGLTGAGKGFAIDACQQCEYVGPAPVSLTAYQSQINKQSIMGERITLNDLAAGLSHLVLPDRLIRRLGPAVNSGRAILIYGPPGNGKTSISEAIGKIFKQAIYVPHCIEVEGQVIRVFDPTVHTEIETSSGSNGNRTNLLRKVPDPRWVKCKRPVILTGGELTLETLDLQYDRTSKFYEAPPQMKALGGVCIIDDFGRQRVQPYALLNRWIVPLERRVDYLTIHTGRKFDIPFDEIVIFSTNIPPLKLMDTAQLRRVKYKLRVEPPSVVDYATIFHRTCKQHGLELQDSILTYLLEDFYPTARIDYAGYHPIFFVEHAIAACRYKGTTPRLTLDLVKDALEDLFITEDESDLATPQLSLVNNKVS